MVPNLSESSTYRSDLEYLAKNYCQAIRLLSLHEQYEKFQNCLSEVRNIRPALPNQIHFSSQAMKVFPEHVQLTYQAIQLLSTPNQGKLDFKSGNFDHRIILGHTYFNKNLNPSNREKFITNLDIQERLDILTMREAIHCAPKL